MAWVKPLLVFLLYLLVASSASAQTYKPLPPGSSVALLPPGGDVEALGLAESTIEAALNALRSESYIVIGPERVTEELRLAGHGLCHVLGACKRSEMLGALRVDALASVVVWLDADGERLDHVFVNLTRATNWGEGEATIGEQGLDRAVSRAMALALKDTLTRHHVVLRVEATPDNAQVEIDHSGVGRAPAEMKVLPGKRVVTVSAKGYETVSNYVDVPPSAIGRYVYKIKLAQSDIREPGLDEIRNKSEIDLSTDRFERSASVWNTVIASGLLAASAALLAPALYSAIREGDCFEKDEYGRCNRYAFGVQSTLFMLGGVFTLGAGVVFILLEPIEGEPTVSLQARPTSIAVTGGF